jgi:hypothetical protein
MTKPSIAELKAMKRADTEKRRQAKLDSSEIPVIVSWQKINSEEPIWIVTIQGSNEKLKIKDIRDITDYRRFTDQCAKQLSMFFMPTTKTTWASILKDARPRMTEVKADEDTTREGQFREILETFLTNRQRGRSREDLLRSVPWEDEDKRRHYFTMEALAKIVEREGMRKVERNEIAAWIKNLGGEPQSLTIKGCRKRCWWVPSDAVGRAPELTLPTMPEAVI